MALLAPAASSVRAASFPCAWAPDGIGLKDHTIFEYEGSTYLVSTHLETLHWEDRFTVARAAEGCDWHALDPILTERVPGSWDEFRVWAPFVLEEGGTFYLFYTGVTDEFTQSILLATTRTPDDPRSWEARGVVFQPDHKGMVWAGWGAWSDARDPMVLEAGGRFYLYYTGLDEGGGIVGVATAASPEGPWQDWGSVLTLPEGIPESPTVFYRDGWYYLAYNATGAGGGPAWRVGPTPAGPWSEPRPLRPGWAHEVWQTAEGTWRVSYLTDYRVTLHSITWSTLAEPPWPVIAERLWFQWLPVVRHGG